MVALLADRLTAAGHRVALVAPSGPGHRETTAAGRSVTHPVRSVTLLPSIRLRLALPGPRELTRLFRRERVELVHTHTEGPLGWSARAAAARLALPAVHTLHTRYHHYLHYVAPSPFAARPAARLLDVGLARFLRGFDLVVTPSDQGHAEVAGLAPELAIAHVPNGVPVTASRTTSEARQRTRALRTRLHLGADDRVLLVVGRIAPEKRTEELLAALLPEVSARPHLRLVLVGGGPLLDRARRTVAACGLTGRVLLPGYQPHADVLALYPLAEVLVSAARSENHPVSLLEAAAAGIPAAVLRGGGLDAHVTAATGVLAADDRSLARAAADLAEDPARQRRLGAAARRTAAARSDTIHVAALRRHYTALLDHRSQPSAVHVPVGR
jgi:1,2-diacylglycerol 3-alpha-glucosyltransferase